MSIWLRRAAAVMAVGYVAALLLVVALLRFVGEAWWVTDVGLYLPRLPLALPLPFIVTALLLWGPRRLLLTQAVAALLVLFPLMGFVLPWPAGATAGAPTLRVLSYNVDSGHGGVEQVMEEIDRAKPDVVLLQELFSNGEAMAAALRVRYRYVQGSSQFLLGTRFPILSTSIPDKLDHEGRERSPRFLGYVLETPLGRLAFYNVHPISPRAGFYALRDGGLRRGLLSRQLWSGRKAEPLQGDTELRGEQLQALAERLAREPLPVVIAGDTNLPGLSPLLHRHLGRYRDGFNDAGWGFGYTFPADRHPWMRLDRILAGAELRFTHFEVGRSLASDHLCVVADLQRR